MDKTSQALQELTKLSGSPEAAQEYLAAVERKRRDEKFICYWSPFEYQKKIFEAFTPDTKILVVCGGNRSGKTEVGASIVTAFAEGKEYFRGEPAWTWASKLPIPEKLAKNIWIVGLDFPNHLDTVIWREKLMTGANHPGFIPKDASILKNNPNERQIFFSNKAVITGKSADSGREKFQSASVDLIWIDEECDAEIFDECYQRTVDCGGRIIVTVTPLTDISSGIKEPWVFNLFEEMKAGRKDIKFVNLSVLDNPVVPQEEKTKLLQKWTGHPEERARLFGEFVRRSGLVYPMFNRKTHLVKPQRPDPTWTRIVSIDPAATGVTAALWAAINPAGDVYIYKEYYESNLVVSDHARNILARCTDNVDIFLIDKKWGAQRDAANHRSGQQLYKDAGIPVRLAEVDEDYGRNAALEYMQATSEPTSRQSKVYITSDCENLIYELEHYVYDSFKRGPLKGLTKEKPLKRDDHAVNALQYLLAMRPRHKGRIQRVYTDEEKARISTRNSYF